MQAINAIEVTCISNELAVYILPEIKLFTFKGIGWKSFNSKKPRANPTVKSTPAAVFGPCPFTLEII